MLTSIINGYSVIFSLAKIYFRDLLFPRTCLFCRSFVFSEGICSVCWKKLKLLKERFYCRLCGLWLNYKAQFCLKCVYRRVYFSQAESWVCYDELLSSLIHRLKFYDDLVVAKKVARTIYLSFQYLFMQVDYIVPVPLHPKRLKERKYNQAAILAHHFSTLSGIKVEPLSLIKIKRSLPQAQLDLKKRRKNLHNAFAIRFPARMRGKTILLVDDVITTTTTVNACAKALKLQGNAKQVRVLSIARTMRRHPL